MRWAHKRRRLPPPRRDGCNEHDAGLLFPLPTSKVSPTDAPLLLMATMPGPGCAAGMIGSRPSG